MANQIVKVCAALVPSASGVRVTLTATDLRAEGKAHFEAGRFFDALESYTGCVHLQPSAALHCNRALAFMNLYKDARVVGLPEGQIHSWRVEGLRRALTDTSVAAIRLDPSYPKAFYLAGMARLSLGRLDPTLDPKARAVMLQMAVETLMQASELSDDEEVDLKVIEATKEMEQVPPSKPTHAQRPAHQHFSQLHQTSRCATVAPDAEGPRGARQARTAQAPEGGQVRPALSSRSQARHARG